MNTADIAMAALRKIKAAPDLSGAVLLADEALKEAEGAEPKLCVHGNVLLDRESRIMSIEERDVRISTLEFDFLWYLMRRFGQCVPRQHIHRDVWHGTLVAERTVDAHIVSLRRLLRESTITIETVYGAGYRLTARERK